MKTDNNDSILAYVPMASTVKIFNPFGYSYSGKWFDPSKNEYYKAQVENDSGLIRVVSEANSDLVLLLNKLN